MSKIVWDQTGERFWETGTDHCVLYLAGTGDYSGGVAWNGITAITESPEGAEATDLWADNIKYASIRAAETFGGTIEAYTYPEEFEACDGSATLAEGVKVGQQSRAKFGLSYRTKKGNDLTDEAGYILHLVYGASCSPSERAYQTINDSPEAITFSWEFDTSPVVVAGEHISGTFKPTSLITIDSTTADSTKLGTLMDILYGTNGTGGAE
jgi:hypothetical protein